MGRKRVLFLLVALSLPLAMLSIAAWGAPALPQSSATAQQAGSPVASILSRINKDEYRAIVESLSGARPAAVGGKSVTFKTRYTPSEQGTLSEQYVYEYFQAAGYTPQYHSWTGDLFRCRGISGRNVIAEIPGKVDPNRIYVMSGHLDSISPNLVDAPGADDNASGTAATMLAAKLLRNNSFDYTIRFIAFTGEERGLCGSAEYAEDARSHDNDIRGVINLDMIAWDGDNSLDVEIHAGTKPESLALANALVENVKEHSPKLIPHVFTDDATNLSDHSSFWLENYPALTFAEYLFHGDMNPYIHSVVCCDTVDHLNYDMAIDLMRAAYATLAEQAGVQNTPGGGSPPTPNPTPVPTVGLPGESKQTFPETGKSVSGLFLEYWQKNGGLAQQGFPISEVTGEKSELDGKPYTVQYFERAVFEYHPENKAPYNVLLSQLGTFRYKEKYPRGAPNQRSNTTEGSLLFRETGKRVGGKFLEYWQKNGGLAQQGYPISDEFTEVSDLDGKTYTVQYFERAVFELHPENAGTQHEVLLSQLGTFRYKEKHQGSK